ncbi:hypothetical protein HG537_0G03480 [Torulaspora globosa]|uniref:ABC1 atypical kinase-like domain-containing protein n=1 Tax=Torulaspora globosa TaxID=48254 RepID=A0A7H9HXP7_9SACH|nr:hypothetical protein HG537_0G03480 [Torulaspora sp. CBS 2947]
MSSRRGLYHAFCLVSSATQVLKGSVSIGRESLSQWVNTSRITRPILMQYQCYYDPEWEEAKRLSEQVKAKARQPSRKSKKNVGTRHYSTSRRSNDEQVEEVEKEKKKQELQSSRVPSSRISRLFHYGSLAAGVGINAASDGFSQMARGQSPSWKSLIYSDSNIDRIARKFSQMRGAALKIGQMMSFQDDKVLPRELYEIISRVQNSAHYMPHRQLERVLKQELGADWQDKFCSFDRVPIAAASIGQVHNAVLKNGDKVVVKIQYPGVKDSIDSDLNNLLMLLVASRLLPKGLFLDKTIANARTELKWECDYVRESQALKKFRKLLEDDPVFVVPQVYSDLTTTNIITMARMEGTEIMKLPKSMSQDVKDFISENIMRLCLEEIATFQYMQTDPNWANFLYNEKTKKIELLDFGASRPYPADFIMRYRKLLTLATLKDREGVRQVSQELGYLTGLESQAMVDAHVNSVMTLGEPFCGPPEQAFSFKDQTVSDRIRSNIGLMLNERLCPPPEETYSLHRKFSGIFLLCARMGASVHCAKLFNDIFAIKK